MIMKLKEFLDKKMKKPSESGPKSEVVISSRVRLARNLNAKVFPWRANTSVLEDIWEDTRDTIKKKQLLKDMYSFYLSDIAPVDRQLLIERHMISLRHVSNQWPRGVIVAGLGNLSIMVNEEDHIRLSAIMPGLNMFECAKMADDVDNKISHERSFRYGNTKMTGDFFIKPNIVIEFFGLAGVQETYDTIISKKRALVKKLKLQLIEIYPNDIYPVPEIKLASLLKEKLHK